MRKPEKDILFTKLWKLNILIILGFIFIAPTISSVFSIILIIITGWYIYGNTNAILRFKYHKKAIVFLSSVFLIAIVSLLWTEDKSLGLKALETQLSLIIFPLVFSFIKIEKRDVLFISICLAILIILSLFFFGIYTYIDSGVDFSLELLRNVFITKIHRTYISLYSISIAFIVFLHFINKKKSSYLGYLFLIPLIIVTQFFESRIAFLTIPLLSIISLFYVKNRKQKLILSVAIPIFVLLALSYIINSNSQRVKDIIDRYKTSISNHNLEKVEDRVIVWRLSLSILQENLLFGVGVGDIQKAILVVCKENTPNLTYTDVHSQYLDILIRYGITGFLFFMLTLLHPLILVIKYNNPYYLIFLSVIFVFFLTESILIRQIGVMFYAIFNSMFYYSMVPSRLDKSETIDE